MAGARDQRRRIVKAGIAAFIGKAFVAVGRNHDATRVCERQPLSCGAQQTDAHIVDVRGEGLMIGIEYDQPIKALRNALVHDEHVFTGAASTNILRLLPPLTLSLDEGKLAVEHIKRVSKVLG